MKRETWFSSSDLFQRVVFSEEKRAEMEALWWRFDSFAKEVFEPLPASAEATLALRKLQECLMWIEAAHTVEARRRGFR